MKTTSFCKKYFFDIFDILHVSTGAKAFLLMGQAMSDLDDSDTAGGGGHEAEGQSPRSSRSDSTRNDGNGRLVYDEEFAHMIRRQHDSLIQRH